jgi:hypothetical protein
LLRVCGRFRAIPGRSAGEHEVEALLDRIEYGVYS